MKWFGFILIGALFFFYVLVMISFIRHGMKDEADLKKLRTPCPTCGSHENVHCLKIEKKGSCL